MIEVTLKFNSIDEAQDALTGLSNRMTATAVVASQTGAKNVLPLSSQEMTPAPPAPAPVAPAPPAPAPVAPAPPAPPVAPAAPAAVTVADVAKLMSDKSNELGSGDAVHAILVSFGKGKLGTLTPEELAQCKAQVEAL